MVCYLFGFLKIYSTMVEVLNTFTLDQLLLTMKQDTGLTVEIINLILFRQVIFYLPLFKRFIVMKRIITDEEVQLKQELVNLTKTGLPSDILKASIELANLIIESAEIQASLSSHWSESQRKHLSDVMKGKPHKSWTKERREKITALWANPEKRKKQSDKLKGRKRTQQEKNSISQGMIEKNDKLERLQQTIAQLQKQINENKLDT